MVLNPHNRDVFQRDWVFCCLWLISPYVAVGVVSYFGRRSLPISIFGLVSAIAITLIAAGNLPEDLLDGGREGKAMAVGFTPMFQWIVAGPLTVIGLLMQAILYVLKKRT
jgi:hypothetical protein